MLRPSAPTSGSALPRLAVDLGVLLEGGMGILMLILPPLRLIMGGPGWITAIREGQPIIAAVDIALLLAGIWMLARIMPRRTRGLGSEPLLQAAE